MFHVFSSQAQFERRMIQERTAAGLTAARARAGGRLGGRRPITGTDPRVQAAKRLNQDPSLGIDEICKTLGTSRSTFYRRLAVADRVRKYEKTLLTGGRDQGTGSLFGPLGKGV